MTFLGSQTNAERRSFFGFPDPVNDVAARTVATGVVIEVVALLLTHNRLIFIPLCYGFAVRLMAGPKISPLGLFATRIAAPRMKNHLKLVPGKPKRFAQGIGVVFSFTAAALALGLHSFAPAAVVLGMLAVAASLEAALGFCLGCKAFAILFRFGIVSYDDCPNCVIG